MPRPPRQQTLTYWIARPLGPTADPGHPLADRTRRGHTAQAVLDQLVHDYGATGWQARYTSPLQVSVHFDEAPPPVGPGARRRRALLGTGPF